MGVFGKGRKYRTVALSATTGISIDRYLRARRKLPIATLPALWLARHKAFRAVGLGHDAPSSRRRRRDSRAAPASV